MDAVHLTVIAGSMTFEICESIFVQALLSHTIHLHHTVLINIARNKWTFNAHTMCTSARFELFWEDLAANIETRPHYGCQAWKLLWRLVRHRASSVRRHQLGGEWWNIYLRTYFLVKRGAILSRAVKNLEL